MLKIPETGKAVKLVSGLGVAVLGLYILLSEGVAVVSADAVLNARVAVVRAPIDGQLTFTPRRIGEAVREGEPLGSLRDVRADTARLLDLERAEKGFEADIIRINTRLGSIERSLGDLSVRTDAYRDGRIGQLKAKLEEARTSLAAAEARLQATDKSFTRSEALLERGNQTAAAVDQARADRDVDAQDVAAARARLRALEIEAAAAARGTFLGDSYNDTPYSTQRSEELLLQQITLTADLTDAETRLAAVRSQLTEERLRVAQLREAFLTSPVNGLVWEAPLGNGEYARKGQDLLRLLDCAAVMVTASVGESDYNSLKVGDPARFRPSSSSKIFDGTILRLAGSGAATVYNNLAIAPSEKHLERFDVALGFPALLNDPELGCAVGRTGKVSLGGGPSDMMRSLGRWLGLR